MKQAGRPKSVYERLGAIQWWRWLGVTLLGVGLAAPWAACSASGDSVIVEAREALRKKDRTRLAAARTAALAANHPLAMWVDYLELGNRLAEVQQAELDAFYARWPGTYVEDRLRNDWLLELGKRRDWVNFAVEYPRFRMNDDREVSCYALMLEHQAGKDVHDDALATWLAQRDGDDGCALMAATLTDAKKFTGVDLWRKARFAIDAGRPKAARQAAVLISTSVATSVGELSDNPARYLAKNASATSRQGAELATLALMRLAATDPDAAALQLNERWDRALPPDLAAWAWAAVGKQAALKLLPDASEHFQRAALRASREGAEPDWPDDTLAWKARAALRANEGRGRWQQVVQAVNAMSSEQQRDPAWIYWKARALQSLSGHSEDPDGMRELARELLARIAGRMHFYGKLAAEDLGQPITLPSKPAPLTAEEVEAAKNHPGLTRALQLIALGLRNEGVREWNYSLRGMGDRELLAAAQRACDSEVWDRCINTSDRTREEIDIDQRFPMPFRTEVQARAKEIGLDPAYVYGLIRQESRFVMDARSSVGASGLMQIMPATARWTARKIGLRLHARPDHRPRRQPAPGHELPQAGARRLRRFAGHGRGGLQRRPEPAAPLARGAVARGGHLGGEHPVQRNARLRQEGAQQCHLLRGSAERPDAVAEGPAGPADRPARRRGAAARQAIFREPGPGVNGCR